MEERGDSLRDSKTERTSLSLAGNERFGVGRENLGTIANTLHHESRSQAEKFLLPQTPGS
jgi:hypothetical protein